MGKYVKGTVLGIELRESFEKYIRKARPEVRSINVQVFLTWNVDLLAPCAVGLHSRGGELLAQTDRQDKLSITQDALAASKRAQRELLAHHSKASWRQNVARMNQSVKVHGRLVDF